ncbi:nitrate regulatory protein [Alteromonas sp. C1M14]|uniref:nitrate regulatory protein n=1 Tax=Alteromonas sp. C1M14 TaxID=2841567 RepID=UPI001C085D12|nr:nitrate regulatory protein [Alteromonas sp. C1M14]MBU2977581.1 nitrate- and nitrite sensing domain-containing protein [Alteromonas sp. C1M14]
MATYSEATKRFLLAAKHAEIQALNQLASNCRLVTTVAEMIHQLQRERGASNIFLASKGLRFSQHRMQQVDQSRLAEGQLRSQLKSLYLGGDENAANMRLLASITMALQGLDNLPMLRQQIEDRSLTALSSTQAFCRLIGGLLTVIFEAADVASDPAITRILVALFNFLQGKEYAGQERAWGAIGFAETHFDSSMCKRLKSLQQDQDHSFDIFTAFACPTINAQWEQVLASEMHQDVLRLRSMIQQLADGSPIDGQISEVWYDVTTKRIDAMKDIEETLTAALVDMATKRVTEADAELKNHRQRLKSLEQQSTQSGSPLTMLFDPQIPGLRGSESVTANHIAEAENLSAHRSFYDLLCDQSEHIKTMSAELDEARRAIIDQKNIDRAKLLLMQQWQLTEEKAYRRLQKSAMDQNCRLADVAAKVVKAAAKVSSS